MSRNLLLLAVLGAVVAACAPKPAPEPVVANPVTTEPTYTSKY